MVNSRLHRPNSAPGPSAGRVATRSRKLAAEAPALAVGRSLRTFIIGPENRLALAAVQGALGEQGARFSPLTFVGPRGCGKSHLLAGLAAAWQERFPGATVVLERAADFARGFVASLRAGQASEFRGRLEDADVLILDDLDQFATKLACQQVLLATLDELQARGKMAVFAARCHPGLLRELAPPLRSRLVGGLVAPLHPAAADSRRTILQNLLAGLRLRLTQATRDLLAERSTSVCQMQTLVALLSQPQTAAGIPAGEAVPQERVEELLAACAMNAAVTLRRVAEKTARHFSLTLGDLRSPSRRHSLVFARDVGMFLARELTNNSLNKIGDYFGGRDHTTVMHGCRKIEELLRTDPATRQTVDRLRSVMAVE